MKIHRIHINHFGKLENLTLTFSQGIHLITGENEAGKSTLHAFLQSMFFGMERRRGRAARTDLYSRYLPWKGSSTYGGVLELEKGGVRYAIHRNFEKNIQPCTLLDETHARQLTPSEANFAELLNGLTPTLYRNTLSVGQLRAATSQDLAEELRNHIVNLRTSGSSTVDVSQALLYLKKEKKKQENAISRDAQQEAIELEKRIQLLEHEQASLPQGEELPALTKQKEELDQEILRLGKHHQQLTQIIAKGEDTLKKYGISREEDVEELLEEVDAREEERQRYLQQYRKPLTGALRPLCGLLNLLLAAGALAGLWLACTMALSSHYLPAAGCFLGSILSGTFCVRLNRRREASADYRQDCRILAELYQDLLREAPSCGEGALALHLREQLEYCRKLCRTISRSRQALSRDMDALLQAQQKQPGLQTQLEEAQRQRWSADQKGEALRSLQDRWDALQEPLRRSRQAGEEKQAIELAMETIQELSTTVFDSFGFFLEEKASELVKGITDGAYTGLSIDEDLGLTLLRNGQRIPLFQVSAGTVEQVYLAFRLACIEFLWPDEQMPLFLDDTFAFYDNERLSATLCWLSENYSGQIFLFTCHEREEEILSTARIPYQKISLT